MARKPKWPIRRTIEVGHRGLELVAHYRAELEARLAAGLVDGLTADVAVLEGRVADAVRAPHVLKRLTKDQDAATVAGHALVMAVRNAIAKAGATKAESTAFGVGLTLRKKSVSQVAAGLDMIINAAARYPDRARAAGVLASDIEAATSLRTAVTTADGAQERGKEARKITVAERNGAAVRVEDAVTAISGAGELHFYARPEIAEQFSGLVPSKSRGHRAAPTTGAETP